MRDPFATLPWIKEEKKRSGLYDCAICQRNTLDMGHYYAVDHTLWHGLPDDIRKRMLCIFCLEDLIGRELEPVDFLDAPINVNAAMNDPEVARRMFGSDWQTVTGMFRRWVELYAKDYAAEKAAEKKP